jgi:hypothetical protein
MSVIFPCCGQLLSQMSWGPHNILCTFAGLLPANSRFSTMLPKLICLACPGESCWEWRVGSTGLEMLAWEAGNVGLGGWPWPQKRTLLPRCGWALRTELTFVERGLAAEVHRPGRSRRDKGFEFCKKMHCLSWVFLSRVLPDPEDLGTSGWVCPQTLGHHPPLMERCYCIGRQEEQDQGWWVDYGKTCRQISYKLESGGPGNLSPPTLSQTCPVTLLMDKTGSNFHCKKKSPKLLFTSQPSPISF